MSTQQPPGVAVQQAAVTQSPAPPALLPSLFPANSISPARRDRTASTAGSVTRGRDAATGVRHSGLSPRNVNVPSAKRVATTETSIKPSTMLFKSAKEVSKIGLTKSFGSAASKLASLQNKVPNTRPPADVFFTPPALPTASNGLNGTCGGSSSKMAPKNLFQADIRANSLKRTAPASQAVDPTSASKRRRAEGGMVAGPAMTTKQTAEDVRKEGDKMAEWRAKYTKAFPNFAFYFDADVSANMQGRLREKIKKLGGRIEPFLSNKVTHHITVRGPSPSSASKKTSLSQPTPPSQGHGGVVAPKAAAQDLRVKVWSVDKLIEVLRTLLGYPQQSPAKPQVDGVSLSTLLEDERLHGTRERDAAARRADHFYFTPGNGFLLVEDALGEHRPVMVKEYERATHQNEVPAWPILHGSFLRISEPALENTIPIPELREHAWKTWVERDESHTEAAGTSGTMSRSISSTSLNQEKISQESLIPYQAASGNSVVLTSTIASTSNAHMSGGTPNGAHGFIGNGAAAYAQGKDKRVIDMTKRVQVLKRNFMRNGGGNSEPSNTAVEAPSPRSQATAKPAPVERAESEESDDTVGDYMPEVAADERDERAHQVETGDDTEETQSKRDASPPARQMNQVVRDRVLRMLRKSRKGTPMPPSVQRIHWELKGLPGRLHLKRAHGNEVTRKPGYCENCRVKFDDFDTHLLSRRHQKFAADDGNFVVIDELINRLQRPSGRWTAPSFFSYEHAEPPVDANTYDLPQAIREDLLKLPAIEARQQLQAHVQSAEADRRENRRLEASKISDENWDLYR